MNLKKITAIMIGAVMAVSMAVPAMADDKVETVTDGKLTVATSPDFAPYEFYSIDEDGNPTLSGFDMDLAQYIADNPRYSGTWCSLSCCTRYRIKKYPGSFSCTRCLSETCRYRQSGICTCFKRRAGKHHPDFFFDSFFKI